MRRATTRLTLATCVAAVAAAAFSVAAPAQRATLPDACRLLTRAEASALAGVKMQPPNDFGSNCGYNGYPTGPEAQVLVYIQTKVPNSLLIDRKLGNKFRKVPHLGDQAFEEEWHIFVRKGSVWVDISLVRLEPWPAYRAKLEHAARTAIARVRR